MNDAARILVATEDPTDGALVRKLLNGEFSNVAVSSVPGRAVADFEQRKPNVLILAFKQLDMAERYYLGLYRLGESIHAIEHRTVILCDKEQLRRVYELCRKEYFDDYVLFWPMAQDAHRLPMSVHQALKQMASDGTGTPGVGEFAAQARRIVDLEARLVQFKARGEERVDQATRSLHETGLQIGDALDGFSRRISGGDLRDVVEVRDPGRFRSAFDRLKSDEIDTRLRSAQAAVQPLREWAGGLERDLAPQLESARALRRLACSVLPRVLVVEDDEYQRTLLTQLLSDADLELRFAATGAEALGLLRKHRPDLILMDVGLPDIDGIEVTRRLKASAQYAAIPVVMITGYSDRSVVLESMKAGAVDFVVKPLERQALLAKLRKTLA